MCVATIPALGIIASIGQAVVGFAAASQAAAEQNAYWEENRRAAIQAANDRYAALAYQTLQEREKASQELFEKQIEAMKARATAAVSAGEAGVTGLSVDALMQDFLAQQGRQFQAIKTNYEIRKQYNYDEAVAYYHHTIGRINSVRRASKPSPLPFVFQALGGIAGAYRSPGTYYGA